MNVQNIPNTANNHQGEKAQMEIYKSKRGRVESIGRNKHAQKIEEKVVTKNQTKSL